MVATSGRNWHLAPSLVALFDEVDAKWPNRNRRTDGSIGDASHAARYSEHNPDRDSDGMPRGAVSAVDITATDSKIRAELLDELIGDPRTWYVINKRRIWSRTYGWREREYDKNPHDSHIHVSLVQSKAAHDDRSRWLAGAPKPNRPADESGWQQGDGFPGPDVFRVGASHPAVTVLDERLIAHGFAKHHDGNGYQPGPRFTEHTRENVRDFQLAQGWTGNDADGLPGKSTWKRLGDEPATDETDPEKTPTTPAVEVARAAGIENAEPLIRAALAVGLPLAAALAAAEKESGGKNIYGHDAGGTFTIKGDKAVTMANFHEFYDLVVNKGRRSNGVGPLQITYPAYFPQAKREGLDLWKPYDNAVFGFRILKANHDRHQDWAKVGTLYNAGNLNGGVTAYGRDFAAKVRQWEKRLDGAEVAPEPKPDKSKGGSGKFAGYDHVPGTRVISEGDRSEAPLGDVAYVQRWVGCKDDGIFGPVTRREVKRYQRRQNLAVDGVVGDRTWAAILDGA